MPSLFRFLVFVGLIGGLAYVAVFSLANFVKYQPREIIVTIPPDKFLKNTDAGAQARRWPAGHEHPTKLWSSCSSTCWRPSAAPARTRSTPIATTSPILSAHLHAAGRSIADATTDDLRGFLSALAERGFKASSLARRLSAVRQLYRFLYAEGKRTDDPAAVLEGPKRGRSLPKVLSIAEVDAC